MRGGSGIVDQEIPAWINSRLYFLRTEGRLVLSNEPKVAEDFAALSSPSVYKQIRLMKILDISRTNITTIDGFRKYPKLVHFIANNTKLENFKGFSALSSVSTISLLNTPISQLKTFRIALVLAVGPNLKSVNGKAIPQSVFEKAQMYPEVCGELVNRGWIPEFPPPDSETLENLCQEYGIDSAEHPTEFHTPKQDHGNEEEEELEFEDLIRKLRKEHEEEIQKGKAIFGMIDADEEEDVGEQVSSIMGTYGVKVDPRDEQSIIEMVKRLVELKNKSASKA